MQNIKHCKIHKLKTEKTQNWLQPENHSSLKRNYFTIVKLDGFDPKEINFIITHDN